MASAPASEVFPTVQTLLELVVECVGTLALAWRLVFKTPNNSTSSVHEPWDVEALQYATQSIQHFG